MNEIGRRIFFVKSSGIVVLDTGEKSGTESMVPPTVEDDYNLYSELTKYNRESLDHVDLEYGQYKNEFGKLLNFTVNPETHELDFAEPTENTVVPMEERLANIESSIIELATLMAGGSENV